MTLMSAAANSQPHRPPRTCFGTPVVGYQPYLDPETAGLDNAFHTRTNLDRTAITNADAREDIRISPFAWERANVRYPSC